MAKQMAQVSHPAFFSSLVRPFGSFDAAPGRAVNLVAVLCILGIGLCFLSGDRRLRRTGGIVGATVCLLQPVSAWEELAPLPACTDLVATSPDGKFDIRIADQSELQVDILSCAPGNRDRTRFQ